VKNNWSWGQRVIPFAIQHLDCWCFIHQALQIWQNNLWGITLLQLHMLELAVLLTRHLNTDILDHACMKRIFSIESVNSLIYLFGCHCWIFSLWALLLHIGILWNTVWEPLTCTTVLLPNLYEISNSCFILYTV
jgi:hypothetical protein